MSWGDGSGVPGVGKNTVLVGIDNKETAPHPDLRRRWQSRRRRRRDAARDSGSEDCNSEAATPGLAPPHVLTNAGKPTWSGRQHQPSVTPGPTVKKNFLIKWLCVWIDLATSGRESEEDSFVGYLYSLWDSLSGDSTMLAKVCEDHHYCAEIRAILLIAQKVRYKPGEVSSDGKPILSPRDVLKDQASTIADCFESCGLEEPPREEVSAALDRCRMFTAEEIKMMLATL